jgi:hypothetical protein
MSKIKKPTLIHATYNSYRKVYEVDVEGTKILATYVYDAEDKQRSGWDYDLTRCFVGLDEEEIQELEDDFHEALCEVIDGGLND